MWKIFNHLRMVNGLHLYSTSLVLSIILSALQYIPTFTHSHIHSYTDGRVYHARCQLAHQEWYSASYPKHPTILHMCSHTNGTAIGSSFGLSILPNTCRLEKPGRHLTIDLLISRWPALLPEPQLQKYKVLRHLKWLLTPGLSATLVKTSFDWVFDPQRHWYWLMCQQIRITF